MFTPLYKLHTLRTFLTHEAETTRIRCPRHPAPPPRLLLGTHDGFVGKKWYVAK